ncbi:MAG: AAA family ATPase [Acidobacteriota bacterium]
MFELTGAVKLRYWSTVDQFLRVRCFGPEEIGQLVSGIDFKDRRAYVQFVINTMVVDYSDRILPELIARHSVRELPGLEEQLFSLCIDVNPALHLDAVSKYMNGPEAAPLVFLERAPAARAPMPVSRDRLLSLEGELRSHIIGQDEAVRTVADAVKKAYVGFRDEEKPVGNFLFVGPTGVGKTELAKMLARSLFSDAQGLVRIDCSEYSQPHEYAKLIGSPPGYIGHDEGGQLTEALRRRPHVVVLFDEIEKADGRVHDLLLQILDDGVLTDSKGSRVSFKSSIVILTSNVGTRELDALASTMGFLGAGAEEDRERRRTTNRAIEKFFRPEFLNRVDEVILFRSFTEEEARRVVQVMLEEVAARLAAHGITILFSEEVRDFLAERGINRRYGARPLRRAIKRYVEAPLATYVLDRGIDSGTIEARVSGEALAFVS